MGGRTPFLPRFFSSPRRSLLSQLLGANVTIVATLALAAVSSLLGKACITLAANHLFALIFGCKGSKRRLNFHLTEATTTKTEHQMQRWFFLNVIIGESTAIFELLACEDKALLIGRNSLLVLNLGPTHIMNSWSEANHLLEHLLDIVDRVWGLHLERDGLARQSFNENLHIYLSIY